MEFDVVGMVIVLVGMVFAAVVVLVLLVWESMKAFLYTCEPP